MTVNPRGILPYISHIGQYVPPQRVGFLRSFGLKTGIDVDHFGLESGMVFKGTTGVYERISCFNSKWVRKNRNSFLLLFYSKQSDYLTARPGLRTGMGFRGQVWKRVWKMTFFWSEIGSGFEEPGRTPPPRIPRSSPRESFKVYVWCFVTKE